MIFYGSKRKRLKNSMTVYCPCKCGSSERSSFGMATYGHLFWIPVAVFIKEIALQCRGVKKL